MSYFNTNLNSTNAQKIINKMCLTYIQEECSYEPEDITLITDSINNNQGYFEISEPTTEEEYTFAWFMYNHTQEFSETFIYYITTDNQLLPSDSISDILPHLYN